MKTKLEISGRELTLHRYPKHLQHPSWQAWDAADEYLIEHVESLEFDSNDKNLLILNDGCGALACWFVHANWKNIDWLSDSYVSTVCAKKNLDKNDLNASSINFLDSLTEPKVNPDVVLIKIPKTSALLQHQLIQLQMLVSSDTIVIATAKAKDIHTSTLKLFEKYLGETKTSLAKKKSRLVFVSPTGDKQHDNPYPTVWKTGNSNLTINNHPNVFSRHQFDIGARFLIDNLPDCSGKTVVDLGCGNGVVGLSVLSKYENSKMVFIDESYMAIASAKSNVEQNFPEKINDCAFLVTNCMDNYESLDRFQEPDIVLCNPPFHQQHGITDHIAEQMFKDAKKYMTGGGELLVIGNRHLDYHQRLKKLFGSYEVVASNRKFSVLSVSKP